MKTSMKLKTIMRNMDIRHSDYTYYLSRSPKHRLPDGKVYKRRKARTAAWYVDRKDIPAVVNSLPARTEKAKAYKMRMVQGAVQPDLFCGRNIGETVERALFEGCGGRTAARRRSWLGRSIAAGCGCSRPILTDTPQLTALLRRSVLGTIASTAEKMSNGSAASLELAFRGLWHACYRKFDDKGRHGIHREACNGEKMIDIIEKKGLMRQFHESVLRTCSEMLSR
jgi:hypothetical protein